MPKFEIKFKLQGLELEVKGEREDIAKLTENLSQQLAGLIPTPDMADEPPPHHGFLNAKDITPEVKKPTRRRKQRNAGGASTGDNDAVGGAVDWRNDPQKWGSPRQGMSTADKAIWILYVVNQELQIGEMPSKQIADTFNKHFRQAGTIRSQNVSRDLGKRKQLPTPEVGQDTSKGDEPWFLTESGIKAAVGIIQSLIGPDAA